MSEKKQHPPYDCPIWFDGKKINEVKFCEEFRKTHPMVSVNDTFFTTDGRVHDESSLRKEIYDCIKSYVTTGIAKKVTNLLDVLRMECNGTLPLHTDRIHVANGTLFLDGTFTPDKDFCRNRLPVAYNPNAEIPHTWIQFLPQLIEPEDIVTLQEFMGYCFLPTTKGQKMLIITGKGGEDKSRIGVVLRALLGDNMNTGSISKVETSPFARADLEHELLMLDDDMKLEALPQTNNIKAIVTAELPMDLEKKGKQSYQGDIYVRFLGLGNGTLQSLYDRSVGFFRRQILLTARERDPNRQDDPYIADKMCVEAEGIFLWCLAGLQRLIANDYHFTISQTAREIMQETVSDGNNILEFLASDGYFRFKADLEVSSKDFYAIYKMWCEDNATICLSQKSFCSFLKQAQRTYNLEYTNKVSIGGGKYARGFMGIELLQRPFL